MEEENQQEEEENQQEQEEVYDDPNDDDNEDNDIVRPPGVRFATQGHRVSFYIIEPRVGINPVLWVEAAIRDIHNYVTERVPGRALIGISICNDRFSRGTGGLSFRPVENFNYADLWNLISSISQSNEILGIGVGLVLQVCYIEMPVGAGRCATKLNDVQLLLLITTIIYVYRVRLRSEWYTWSARLRIVLRRVQNV